MALELTVLENIQKLTWNFEDIKKELTANIEKYSNLVVSETNLPDMEKTQREIASLRIKIGKFKTAVKKDYNKPFEVFELQVSELAKLVESAEKPIKDQIQKYEDKRRELKSAEIKQLIIEISEQLGLDEKYSSQLVVADNYLNKGSKIKEIKEDIQSKVCWFLEIQAKDIAEEANRIEKINMAKMMVELLSKDLITPLTFENIENKIDQLNITELRTYIETQVAGRKEREERAKQVALEQEEQKRIQEVNRLEKDEQARIAEVDKQVRIAEAHAEQLRYKAEQEQQDMVEGEAVPEQPQPIKKYNAQFIAYNVTEEQIKIIADYFKTNNFEMKYAVKEV